MPLVDCLPLTIFALRRKCLICSLVRAVSSAALTRYGADQTDHRRNNEPQPLSMKRAHRSTPPEFESYLKFQAFVTSASRRSLAALAVSRSNGSESFRHRFN